MRSNNIIRGIGVSLLATMLAGCMSAEVRREIDGHEQDARAAISRPSVVPAQTVVQANERLFIPVKWVKLTQGQQRSTWLASKRLNLDFDTAVPLSTILGPMVSKEGVNVVSDVPLGAYTWSGQIKNADLDTVLRVVLGGVGLDYEVDDSRQLVTVRPVRSRTWTMNLGPRTTTYSSGGINATSLNANDTDVTSAGSGGGMARSFTGMTGSGAGQEGVNGARLHASDNFWQSLTAELDNRLQVLLPEGQGAVDGRGTAPAPVALPAAAGAITGGAAAAAAPAVSGQSSQGNRKWIGSYAINPETGSVTVSGPTWLLNDLDNYFTKVNAMYNASITFKGELLMVSRKRSDTEGLDISSFAKFANGRYGAVVQNNALGGVTVSMPAGGGLPSVSAGAQKVGGALFGVTSAADSLQVFNAWLSEAGRVSVLEEPTVTTGSGVPAEFNNKTPTYYNLLTQKAASGGISGAVSATENTVMSKSFGTQLTINPRFDYSTGLIRAQIYLNHVLPNGVQEIKQTINAGNGTTSVPTLIPLSTEMSYSGEALLRDGDLIVIGGLSKQNRSLTEDGLPGRAHPLSGIAGKKAASRDQQTYYFALRVHVKER